MTKTHKGVLRILSAAFFFAVMNVFIKLAGDLPFIQKSFFRNLIAFLFALAVIIKQKKGFGVMKDARKYLILRAVFGTVGVLCNFYAVDTLILADANMLNKMSPFFAILFSWLILKEKITPFQGSVVCIAFLGGLFVIKPSFVNMDCFPAIIGLLGGLGAGTAYTMVRKLGQLNIHSSIIIFYFSAFSCLVTLPSLFVNYHPMTAQQLLFLLCAGFAATAAQFSLTSAYYYAPAKEISVFDYAQILFSAIFGFFLFQQIPDLFSWIGYFIIIGSAVLMFLYNSRGFFHKKPPHANS